MMGNETEAFTGIVVAGDGMVVKLDVVEYELAPPAFDALTLQ